MKLFRGAAGASWSAGRVSADAFLARRREPPTRHRGPQNILDSEGAPSAPSTTALNRKPTALNLKTSALHDHDPDPQGAPSAPSTTAPNGKTRQPRPSRADRRHRTAVTERRRGGRGGASPASTAVGHDGPYGTSPNGTRIRDSDPSDGVHSVDCL